MLVVFIKLLSEMSDPVMHIRGGGLKLPSPQQEGSVQNSAVHSLAWQKEEEFTWERTTTQQVSRLYSLCLSPCPNLQNCLCISSTAQETGRSQWQLQEAGAFTNRSCLLLGQHEQSSEEQLGSVGRDAAYRARAGIQKEAKLAKVGATISHFGGPHGVEWARLEPSQM